MYLLTLPENRLERKGRVAGWVSLHLDKPVRNELHALCQRLKDRGVTYVVSSDLDSDALNIVANELHSDHCSDWCYRKFNIGGNHGSKAGHVQLKLEQIINKWKNNDCVPIRGGKHGGDSWKSVERRLLASVAKLLERPGVVVFITDAQSATLIIYGTPEALLMNGTGLGPGKIYKVEKPNAKP